MAGVPALALVTAVLTAALPAPATPAAPPAGTTPVIAIDRDRTAPGDRVLVRLGGWPAGTAVIEICGNGARRGSADCAVHAGVQTYVPTAGTAHATLTVTAPPVGCPCVVRVTGLSGRISGTVPVVVAGISVLPAPPEAGHGLSATADLEVTRVTVTGRWSWSDLFAGPAKRTLLVEVRNNGAVPAVEPAIAVTLGRGAEPTGFVPPPLLDTLDPGEQRTVRLPVTIGAPAVGTYTVRGEVGSDRPARFSVTVATYPWGLVGVAAVLVVILALVELRRARRASRRSRTGVGADPR
ncbi:hypothetical protein OG792_14765 [Micromonospora sp. NBC_01699]|uniref:hypothetical protein n=1 Tax=Micromonospora sp. NBC_01699 TaxID=2975984 RepID=UPI002E318D40|nr:hypothetical protein [Micromonospora sp. NBC_01699]